ncbi:hypothetical protein TESG_05151 [Trichophyton tonsurans CBS 112818]|uniref:Inner centromere protein ARK-binding domain-containing protein n=1 Tax=Trichophyton tonsurans (strain CBS 112818) TaxID=647933 RepID=F2S2F1_TRIT1|nr:hypothetical protein TESG_05151 [Trichophyton tonsurans CBS 112818]
MVSAIARARKPVGSKEWIAEEKENCRQLVQQELDEVEFPVRHEMDWLNEHMAEIFTRDQFSVTELFKTPGKMRGKTPRTARKILKTPREARVPLSDIFSSGHNARHSSGPTNRFTNEIAKLLTSNEKLRSPLPSTQNSNPNYNTDSGYHGMPDSLPIDTNEPGHQMEIETATQVIEDSTILPVDGGPKSSANVRRITEDSFHSAREVAPSKENTVEPLEFEYSRYIPKNTALPKQHPPSTSPRQEKQEDNQNRPQPLTSSHQPETKEDLDDPNFDDIGSPSDGPTPVRAPIRKSSLTFASLPAREPLTTKRSMGGRMSRTSHIDPPKMNMSIVGQPGYLGRQTGGNRLTQMLLDNEKNNKPLESNDKAGTDDSAENDHGSDAENKAPKRSNKSSTQLLHEKINMLGKSQATRTTKSIAPAPSLGTQELSYPELPPPTAASSNNNTQNTSISRPSSAMDAAHGSPQRLPPTPNHFTFPADKFQPEAQIYRDTPSPVSRAPSAHPVSPERRSPGPKSFRPGGFFHSKSSSVPSFPISPRPGTAGSAQKAPSVVDTPGESTTPAGSPKRFDGPISASKTKLQSLMKSARGLFGSSASVSATAKLETLSPTSQRTQASTQNQPQATANVPPSPAKAPRTRGSIEREHRRKEQELKDLKQMEEQERVREREKLRPEPAKPADLPSKPQILDKVEIPQHHSSENLSAGRVEPAPKAELARRDLEPSTEEGRGANTHAALQSHPLPNEGRRPAKAIREMRKPKPQPVNIRVGTLSSQRIRAESATPAPPSAREPTVQQTSVSKKASNASLLTTASSSGSLKSSASSASSKSKALLAVERKKEQEQREAQRKLDQRREADRKRIAQQEEASRQLQQDKIRHEREQSVTDDPKTLAKKQAIEKRRLENAKRLEQQRGRQQTPSNDTSSVIHSERSILSESQGPARPGSRLGSVQPPSRPHNYPPPNPAKPPKRAHEEQNTVRPPATKAGSVHQVDGKRRKTEEEIVAPEPTAVRPAMAPPIRQSNASKLNNFPSASKYPAAPPVNSMQGCPPIFKNSVGTQKPFQTLPHQTQGNRPAHPLEMAKYANGKIPFAEPNNVPCQPSSAHLKTPGQNKHVIPKSSPAYPNGENIKLPDIPTDSEDEDSDAEPCHVPDWAKEENLHNILVQQESQDGEMVFGPSAPLRMEEIFKGNKERLRKFRDRTSSANWNGPDGLTQDEIKWDMAEREKLKNNGGWVFSPH